MDNPIDLRAEEIGRQFYRAFPEFAPVLIPGKARDLFPSVRERHAFTTGFHMERYGASMRSVKAMGLFDRMTADLAA